MADLPTQVPVVENGNSDKSAEQNNTSSSEISITESCSKHGNSDEDLQREDGLRATPADSNLTKTEQGSNPQRVHFEDKNKNQNKPRNNVAGAKKDSHLQETSHSNRLIDGNGENITPGKHKKMAEEIPCDTKDNQSDADTDGGDGSENGDEGDSDTIEEVIVMTQEEKREMYDVVKTGNLTLLEDLLNKPNADINMHLYGLNLLMVAIKADEEFLCEFLIDNGVDYNHKTTYVDMKEKNNFKTMEVYTVSCRQMAADKDLLGIVEIIDNKNEDLYPFIPLAPRVSKIWQPKPPEPKEPNSEEDDSDNQGSDFSDDEEEPVKKTEPKRGGADSSGNDSDADSGIRSCTGDKDPERETRRNRSVHVGGSPDEGYGSASCKSSMSHSTTYSRARSAHIKKRRYVPRPTKSSMIKKRVSNERVSSFAEKKPMANATASSVEEGRMSCRKIRTSCGARPNVFRVDQSAEESFSVARVRTQSPWHDDVTAFSQRPRTSCHSSFQHNEDKRLPKLSKSESSKFRTTVLSGDNRKRQFGLNGCWERPRVRDKLPTFPTSKPRSCTFRPQQGHQNSACIRVGVI